MPNQAVGFGALLTGGVLLTAAITGNALADVVTGRASGAKNLGGGQSGASSDGSSGDAPDVSSSGVFPANEQLKQAMDLATSRGLKITSTTGGTHVANSFHYLGRAFDASGSPQQMAAYFDAAKARWPGVTELFYDPRGAVKNGSPIPAIGGHSDHVHTAF